MDKRTLTRANAQLFARRPDERFASLDALYDHCQAQKERAEDRWVEPRKLQPIANAADLRLRLNGDDGLHMNSWSFGQLCALAKVSKETVNRVTPETAARVFQDTLPQQLGDSRAKPLQVLTEDQNVRAIHAASYTRLWNTELLSVVKEFATDFVPPQAAPDTGDDDPSAWNEPQARGLYCGEQDLFCFLIDPAGWAEIEGEAFAPGFFLWNSEVGRRSVGIQTFWFQKVCANHLVWDAVEVVDFSRKHTANVHEALGAIRTHIERLTLKRDQRRDGFVAVMKKAMAAKFADGDPEKALKLLSTKGITRTIAKDALEIARQQGGLTIFSVIDALTRLSARIKNGGERTEADQKASALLALA